MFVQFLHPTTDSNGDSPENLEARAVVMSADPALGNVAIGGLAIWKGDGSKKNHPKGVLSVSLPKFGIIAGRPIKVESIDEEGNVTVGYKPAKSGAEQIDRICAAILTAYSDALRAGSDPFVGRFELALPRPAHEVREPAVPAVISAEDVQAAIDATNDDR